MTKQPHKADRVGKASAELLADEGAFDPHVMETAEEGRAPCGDAQQTAEEDDGVDAFATGAGPVGTGFKVKPEGEFVECEGRADAVADGHEPAEENRQFGVLLSQVEQPSVADEEQDDDAPNKVMDVVAAHGNPLEGTCLVDDGADEKANSREGEKECDGGEKCASAGSVGDGGADEEPNTGELH